MPAGDLSADVRSLTVVHVAFRDQEVPPSLDRSLETPRSQPPPGSENALGEAEMVLDSSRAIVRCSGQGVDEPEEGIETVSSPDLDDPEAVSLQQLAHGSACEDIDVSRHLEPARIDPLKVVLRVGARHRDTEAAFRSEDPADLLDDPTGVVDVLDHLGVDLHVLAFQHQTRLLPERRSGRRMPWMRGWGRATRR